MKTQMTTPSNRLPRLRRAPKQAGGIRLTDRDLRVLADVLSYRFLPTSLLVARHFGSPTRGRARLRLLFHHAFLDRQVLPTRGPQMGEVIYSLGPAAVGELAASYGLEPADIRRRRARVEPFFVAHRLLIARTRMALATSGTASGVGLYDWREEAEAKLTVQLPNGPASITPDGMGWIRSRKVRFAFCFEGDRGTMTVGRVAAKFERYVAAARQGVMRAHFGADRFRVLIVAPSRVRLASLSKAAAAAGLASCWMTTEDQLSGDVIFGRIWHRPGREPLLPLLTREQALEPVETAEGRTWRLPPGPDNNHHHKEVAP